MHWSGRETLLEEELSEEQVEAELAPLAAQLAYTSARLGNTSDAIAAYEVLVLTLGLQLSTAYCRVLCLCVICCRLLATRDPP